VRSAGSNKGAGFVVRVITAVAVVALAATTIGGCSSDAKPKVASSPTTTATATQTPTPTPVVAINPLTGLPASLTGPVVAVKIDDTAAGRPSMGLEKADVIYIEEAEGGLSRMVAVFASAKPKVMAVRQHSLQRPRAARSVRSHHHRRQWRRA